MSTLRNLFLAFLLLGSFTLEALAQDTRTHIVQRGETLYRISRQYNMSVDQLRRLNALTGNVIKPGQVLRVYDDGSLDPTPPSATATPAGPPPPPPSTSSLPDPAPITTVGTQASSEETPDPNAAVPREVPRGRRSYIVQSGDTYYSIGVKYGVPAYAIFALNAGETQPLEPQSTIWVPDTPPTQQNVQLAVTRRQYTVKQGDTLYGIAREFTVTVEALREENGLRDNTLSIGQQLFIPEDTPTPAAQPAPEATLPALYETGQVVPYEATFAGRLMASGRPYDPSRYSVSHPDLSLESIVLLINTSNGNKTFAEVMDRGPLDAESYIMDVSEAVSKALGLDANPDATIQVRVVE